MAGKSIAQMIREQRGIEPKKNPKKVESGIKGAIASGNTTKKREAMRKVNAIPKGGQQAFERAISEQTALQGKMQTVQGLKKSQVIEIFSGSAVEVAERLVSLAMGRDGFHDAPASVQRLAMVDVLTYAGISQQEAEKHSKPVSEMTREELEAFIQATQQIVEKVNIPSGQVIEQVQDVDTDQLR